MLHNSSIKTKHKHNIYSRVCFYFETIFYHLNCIYKCMLNLKLKKMQFIFILNIHYSHFNLFLHYVTGSSIV